MTKNQAFELFEKMIIAAKEELFAFTLSQPFVKEQKADRSLVTDCDKAIDARLCAIAKEAGLRVVSEEGEHIADVVMSGNYITIDPIDGTLGYIDYVNFAVQNGEIQKFLQKDLGPEHDFCLLLGIVENGKPTFGCVYNFITHEKILLDSENRQHCIRENNVRHYSGKNVVYADQRPGGELEEELKSLKDIIVVSQATLGLKSVYTIINPHESAITVHMVQNAGLWDILPAAVAAKAFGGNLYDVHGQDIKFTEYVTLPPTGAVIMRGERFRFVLDRLTI